MLPALQAKLQAVDDAARRFDRASAAVAILLRETNRLSVLVTERATRESDPWSGQWSFPGGRRKLEEPLIETARRETEEEVGLSLRESEVLGCLEARTAGRREMLILPFVFRWTGAQEPRPGPEVAKAVWVPLRELPATRKITTIHVQGRALEMPAFVEGPRTIWGFTYRALEDLLALLPQ